MGIDGPGVLVVVLGGIIRTVMVRPTLQNVFALGLIVLIGTFLSLSRQLEIDGKLPWAQRVSASQNRT